jgi:hypothetical protein
MAATAENDPTVTAGGQVTRVVPAPDKFKGSRLPVVLDHFPEKAS